LLPSFLDDVAATLPHRSRAGAIHEVTVDAGDGSILKVEKDDADHEREGEDKD
jgi:hypothetical protein